MNPDDLTKRAKGLRYTGGEGESVEDTLAVEAALHVKVNGESYTTTMRTPGDDEALARGLLHTEGIVSDSSARAAYRVVDDPESGEVACLEVTVPEGKVEASVEGRRTTLSASSCGVCGTRDPADIAVYGPPLEIGAESKLEAGAIAGMFGAMRKEQRAFEASGGAHAAAVFDGRGELLVVKEDIGRHNAVDKVVGTLIEDGRLGDAAVLLVSGRVSYEIVYKAYRAGIPFLLAVSAPSSLAVETAERLGMTLVAFCRENRATVYSHAGNVSGAARAEAER